MTYYAVYGGQTKGAYDGNFDPYPDLGELILSDRSFPCICVDIDEGTFPGDMLFAAFNVVSPRFVDILKSCNATGYMAMPMPLMRKNKVLHDYFLIKLLGRGGALDEAKSQVKRSPSGDAIWGYNGVYMDETAWDGSDVFSIPDGIRMYVVEHVAKALKKAHLVNVEITRNDLERWG